MNDYLTFGGGLIMDYMDVTALALVKEYIWEHRGQAEYPIEKLDSNIKIFIVWKCKILQNWKYLISESVDGSGMYYELTFNGDKDEWYLDAYKKVANIAISNYDAAKTVHDKYYDEV